MTTRDRELQRAFQDAVHAECSMKILLGFRMSGLVGEKLVVTNDHPEGNRPQDLVSKLLKKPGKHLVLLEIDSDNCELSRFAEVFPVGNLDGLAGRQRNGKLVVQGKSLKPSRKSKKKR